MRAFIFLLLVLALFGVIMMVAKRLQGIKKPEAERSGGTKEMKTVRCVECGAWLPQDHAVMTARGPACPEHGRDNQS